MRAGRRFRCIIDSRWFGVMPMAANIILVVSTTGGTAVAKHVIYLDARSIVQCRWFVFRIVVGVTSPDAECGISSL